MRPLPKPGLDVETDDATQEARVSVEVRISHNEAFGGE